VRQAVVAVDVGSTSARAGVFDASGNTTEPAPGLGRCLARASTGFAILRSSPHHAEHSSVEIWDAVCTAVREALQLSGVAAADVVGLAFDATCSLAVFDGAGQPVTVSETGEDAWNVVMWADHRAVAEAAEITATGHRVLRHVGGVMSPEMQLPKLLWLKRHMPASWARMGLALDLSDFLAWRATGTVTASACTVTCKWGYLNHEAGEPMGGWQHDLLNSVGLEDFRSRTGLPERALPIGTAIGTLTSRSAMELGLTMACTVGAGLIDAHAGGLGLLGRFSGAALNRRLAMIAGTSTCHMAVSPDPRLVPGLWGPYDSAMLPGFWLTEGGQSATGALLDHVLDLHAEGRPLGADGHSLVAARISELLERGGPDMVGDLRVLPDFNGNRSPFADAGARGVIHGLTLDASFDSLARLYYAAAVGIALGTRHIVARLNAHGYLIDTLHLAGGHIANPVLVRLYADATGCTVILRDDDAILAGTACVAAVAAGLHQSLSASAAAASQPETVIAPDFSVREHFDLAYARFLGMHSAQGRRDV
jgi:FGGY-family pentulose kinase